MYKFYCMRVYVCCNNWQEKGDIPKIIIIISFMSQFWILHKYIYLNNIIYSETIVNKFGIPK